MSNTFTHEVIIDGQPAFSTQLPKGMDPDTYDALVRRMDENVRTEASAGRRGAEDRFELAIRLKLDCPDLADKSWRQLVQTPAYADGVSHINAKYGKAKSAYSNHLTEMRESKHQLDRFFGDRFGGLNEEDREKLVDEWWLDPNRPKTEGGPRKTRTVVTSSGSIAVGTPLLDDDDASDSLVGSMSATTSRLRDATASEWEPYGPDFLNQLGELAREVDRCRARYLTWLRSQSVE